ncbi:MAG: GIY-YIG nuclease family protein [Lachnospiraceae bacterium]|nr:GIY-YIG nuclease family protein [Lachnospiraceae bacterium]MDE7435395.1 GIY-YIG nuclease family protein [Lachnospiraceae bacterium]
MEQIANYTYMVRCSDGTLYIGWTNHIEKRVQDHNSGKGAKYTRGRAPVELVYLEISESKQEAMRKEAYYKRLTRKQKEAMIASEQNLVR